LPRLVELESRFRDRGLTVVSIDPGPKVKAAEEFLRNENVVHPVLTDPDGSVFVRYRIHAIPVTLVIDTDGRIVFRHVGFAPGDEERLAREIESLLPGKDHEA